MTGQAFRSAASSRGDAPRSSELGAGYLANTSICFPARPHRLSLNPTLFLLSRARCRYQPAVAAKLLRAFGAIVVQSQHADEDESCMRSRAAWMSIASQMEDVQNEAAQPDAVPNAMP